MMPESTIKQGLNPSAPNMRTLLEVLTHKFKTLSNLALFTFDLALVRFAKWLHNFDGSGQYSCE